MNQELICVKALSHPLRMEIMKVHSSSDKPLPIKEIALLLQQPPAKLHYHYKKLESAGYLEVAHTREINGITEKFYQSTGLSLDLSLSIKENPNAVAAIMPMIQRRTINAIRRIQHLDPNKFKAGLGSFAEITYSKDKAVSVKKAVADFIKHKEARLPDPDEEGDGDLYDLIFLLVPHDHNPDI